MKYVFVNGRVAIVIRYWEQRGSVVEGGARVDLRRVDQIEGPSHRAGAAGFTVGPVGDGGIWRADLFVVLDGGSSCFHYHPEFFDGDVGHRFDDPDLAADPRSWIEDQLRDIAGLLDRAGAGELTRSLDLDEHRRSLPLIMSAIDTCMGRIGPAVASRAPAG